MRKILSIINENKPGFIGLALIILPLMFWIAAFVQVSTNVDAFNRTFKRMDEISSYLTIFVMFILPLIALVLNFFKVFRFRIRSADDGFEGIIKFSPKLISLGVILFTIMSLGIVTVYGFVENFEIVLR
ncbi:MAG: hypothetical protein IIA45_01710 [Bacteroidetes bacterium]|nr:hypothetical protein [Bacteroidota bacterium]